MSDLMLLRRMAELLAEGLVLSRQGQRHLPGCPVGLWLYGDMGSPCRGRCAQTRLLLQEAAEALGLDVTVWLNAKPPRRSAVDSEKPPS